MKSFNSRVIFRNQSFFTKQYEIHPATTARKAVAMGGSESFKFCERGVAGSEPCAQWFD